MFRWAGIRLLLMPALFGAFGGGLTLWNGNGKIFVEIGLEVGLEIGLEVGLKIRLEADLEIGFGIVSRLKRASSAISEQQDLRFSSMIELPRGKQ